jgi:hypothetical protein
VTDPGVNLRRRLLQKCKIRTCKVHLLLLHWSRSENSRSHLTTEALRNLCQQTWIHVYCRIWSALYQSGTLC